MGPGPRPTSPSGRVISGVIDRAEKLIGPLFPPGSPQRRALSPLANRLRATANPAEGTDPRSRLVAEFALAYPTAFFVQVGSNDGLKLDPLRTHILAQRWAGIMIEPVPYVFEQLTAQYGGHPRIILEKVAVADHDGTANLYYLPQSTDEALPDWYDALATFRKDVLLSHTDFIPDIATRISTIEVPSLTFESLCAKHAVENIDLVQIDTEGYDFEVIKLIDLERYSPKLLMFEHLHLEPADRDACLTHLRQHGYEDISDHMDTVCLRVGMLGLRQRRLLRLWRELSTSTSEGHE
jgi:FkbM family methyltransferase